MGVLALLILLVLIVGILFGVYVTLKLVGVIFTLIVAAIIGWLADRIVPGNLPYGWLGALAAGLLGSWLGGWLLGNFGPRIAGIAVVPALVGAIILAIVVNIVDKQTRGSRL
jgi:uncharacterized membrane protein YeaQ/YmgE (transglycosylase-associated protein family)